MICLLCSIFILVFSFVSEFGSFTRRRGTNPTRRELAAEALLVRAEADSNASDRSGVLRLAREIASGGPARSAARQCQRTGNSRKQADLEQIDQRVGEKDQGAKIDVTGHGQVCQAESTE